MFRTIKRFSTCIEGLNVNKRSPEFMNVHRSFDVNYHYSSFFENVTSYDILKIFIYVPKIKVFDQIRSNKMYLVAKINSLGLQFVS